MGQSFLASFDGLGAGFFLSWKFGFSLFHMFI